MYEFICMMLHNMWYGISDPNIALALGPLAIAGLVGLGSGLIGASQAKEQRQAQEAANRQNALLAAAQSQYAPFLGSGPGQYTAQAVTAPSAGSAFLQGGLQGALSGYQFGQGLEQADYTQKQDAKMFELQKGRLDNEIEQTKAYRDLLKSNVKGSVYNNLQPPQSGNLSSLPYGGTGNGQYFSRG